MTDERYYSLSVDTYQRDQVSGRGGYADHRLISECRACGTRITQPAGVISIHVEPEKGTFWPDILRVSGGFMGLYFSSKVKDVFDSDRIRYGDAFLGEVVKPFPKKLDNINPPKYFHMRGELGAKLDFETSGYRIKSICSDCGVVKPDPSSEPTRLALVDASWNGSDVFYTDLSPTRMFCSHRVFELARKHKWTNFAFKTLEDAHNYGKKPIDYLR